MTASCRHCLFDITKRPDGRWRMAWADVDCDYDPFVCERTGGPHEPSES